MKSPALKSRKREPSLVWRVGRTLFYSWLGIFLVLSFIQRKLIYLPTRVDQLPAAMAGEHVFDVQTVTADGIALNGWHYSQSGDAQDVSEAGIVVLFFHGNGGHRGHREPDCRLLNGLGADVFIFDYRGYAENPGKPSEQGLASDAESVWKYVTCERGVDPNRIVLLGGSLGGGVAIRLAADVCETDAAPGGVFLKSTFSSLVDTAAHHYPWLPVRTVLLDRFASVERIPDVGCPLLCTHGTKDTIVPFEMGQRLFQAAPEQSSCGFRKRFVELPGMDHNFGLHQTGRDLQAALRDFFDHVRRNAR